MGRSIEKVGIAKRYMLSSDRNLLPDVAHHYIHRDHTKLALIHRDHRAVAAQVFITATAFDKSDNTSGAVSQSQMRVARDLG